MKQTKLELKSPEKEAIPESVNSERQNDIISMLKVKLESATYERDKVQERLFSNFNFRFEWDSEKLLEQNQIIYTLSTVIEANSDKVEHLSVFVKSETDRILRTDFTSQYSNSLANIKKRVELNVTTKLINSFSFILKNIK